MALLEPIIPSVLPLTPEQNMATELNPDGWDSGEPVVADEGAADWGTGEEVPLAVEETGISDVQLFNKW